MVWDENKNYAFSLKTYWTIANTGFKDISI